jgi:hypothetical protein
MTIRISRRRFLSTTAAASAGVIAMPYLSRAADRPVITHGVQSGDVGLDGGVVWARADRPSQMVVEVATTESFGNARTLPPIAALPESDFTAKMLLENLPSGQDIFYRIRFRDLAHTDIVGEPVVGRFRTAPGDRRDVNFVWGGDVAGQGWGINPDDGGMFTFATMRKYKPDFFLHSGDTIYADGPIKSEVTLPDGKLWKNVTIPEKAKVDETLDEFRAAHKYNFLDDNLRALMPRFRSSCSGTTMRSPTTGRSQNSCPHPTRSATSPCWRRAQGAPSTKCTRCAKASSSPAGSTAPSTTARISTCSCWTSAAIAAPMGRICSRPMVPTATSSVRTSSPG